MKTASLSDARHLRKMALVALAAILIVLVQTHPSISWTATNKAHPLPVTLAQWQDPTNSGDYFAQVKRTEVGYLVWSQFPLKVYVQKSNTDKTPWANEVEQAVREWSAYLPLVIVDQLEAADIRIVRSSPPLRIAPDEPLRARSAQTSYELIVSNNKLAHRCTILLSPSQSGKYLRAAARHEFGHALGIWGHSPIASDALYFSQVRNPPPISPRDINTLKRVYEQPTQLGWSLPQAQTSNIKPAKGK